MACRGIASPHLPSPSLPSLCVSVQKPVLVVGTKADIPGARVPADEVATAMGLPGTTGVEGKVKVVVDASGATGVGVDEGMAWLCDML